MSKEDNPVKGFDGTLYWYKNEEDSLFNGQLHREDGPAVVLKNGSKKWFFNGKLHRAEGPAIEWAAGDTEWYYNGKLHRAEGPAIEHTTGYKEWFLNGKKHRLNGPSCIFRDDAQSEFCHVEGVLLSDHPLSTWLENRNLLTKFKKGKLTQEQLIEIKLTFGF